MHMTNYLEKKMQLNELKYALFYLYAADVNCNLKILTDIARDIT